MNSKEFLAKKFDKSFNGYKMDEVDEFIKDAAKQMSILEKENKELEKKLEVLADKIREYRDDEEAIKEALLGAQKEKSRMLSQSKEQAALEIQTAKDDAARIRQEAEDDIVDKTALSKKIIHDAELERDRILKQANDEAEEIRINSQLQREKDEKILAMTHGESETFRNNLLSLYEEHIRTIKSFSERCETEFVIQTRQIFEKREAERLEQERLLEEQNSTIEPEFSQPIPEEPVPNMDLVDETDSSAETFEDSTTEILFSPVFEDGGNEEEVAVEENIGNGPFFSKKNKKQNHDKLQFGNNNKE